MHNFLLDRSASPYQECAHKPSSYSQPHNITINRDRRPNLSINLYLWTFYWPRRIFIFPHQHLVNWDKAMLPQIHALGDNYHEWVNSPVDRELRLFGPWYLECLTKTPWWLVPLFWIPCITYLLINECLYNESLRKQVKELICREQYKRLISNTVHRLFSQSCWTSFVAYSCGQ